MLDGIWTFLVEVPRWTEDEIGAVDRADNVATWREADGRVTRGPTEVSLDVEACDEAVARSLVRGALRGLVALHPDAFKASTPR